GRTVASMQVWDILRAVQWVVAEEKPSSSSITVYGKEGMGILGLYAALFDEHVKQVTLANPPASHWQGPALLNILRVSDIPEVAAAFAPRRLVFTTGPGRRVRGWYRRRCFWGKWLQLRHNSGRRKNIF